MSSTATAGCHEAAAGPPPRSQPLMASRRPALPPHLHLIYLLETAGPRGRAAVRAADWGAAFPPTPPGEGGIGVPAPCAVLGAERAAQTGRLQGAGSGTGGGRRRFRGDVAGVAPCPAPACQHGRRLGSARGGQPEPRHSQVLPAGAPGGRHASSSSGVRGERVRSGLRFPRHTEGSGPSCQPLAPQGAPGCCRVEGGAGAWQPALAAGWRQREAQLAECSHQLGAAGPPGAA